LVKLGADHLTVHRLTQRLLRADDPAPTRPRRWSARSSPGLAPGDPHDPRSWPGWADLLLHLRLLDLAETDDEDLARQACEASLYLLRRGEPRASHGMVDPLYRAWRDRLGPSAWPTLWSANNLAQALDAIGKQHDAIVLDRQRLDHFRAAYGDDHPDTLTSASNLANRLAALEDHARPAPSTRTLLPAASWATTTPTPSARPTTWPSAWWSWASRPKPEHYGRRSQHARRHPARQAVSDLRTSRQVAAEYSPCARVSVGPGWIGGELGACREKRRLDK
jgi:hypothetical protein